MPATDLITVNENGSLDINPHEGQWAMLNSPARFICVIAGAQSGKTVSGPVWLWREIERRGPGAYLIAGPSFRLLGLKAIGEFVTLFQDRLKLGIYNKSNNKFHFSDAGAKRLWGIAPDTPTVVNIGHAADPNSLESMTLKGAWLDECGQPDFKLGSWEAIQRRLAVHQGRALMTTTPYDLGWLKTEVYDRWQAGDPHYQVISFDSTKNPNFPQEEFERAKATLPVWRFDMFYRGIFTRPAGLIYDCFEDKLGGHLIPRRAIPDQWKRYVGLDFGGVNTCATFWAEEQDDRDVATGRFICYRCYLHGSRTAAEHTRALLANEPRTPTAVGGAGSEGQWRNEFAAAGLPIQKPMVSEVEVGINRCYAAMRSNTFLVMSDLLPLLTELRTYSRKVDASGNVTEEIADKSTFHHLDSVRYIWTLLRGEEPRIKRISGSARLGYGFV